MWNRDCAAAAVAAWILCAFCVDAKAAADELFGVTDRLQPFGTNYVLSQRTDDDDGSLEATYAFRFMFTGENLDESSRWAEPLAPCESWRECTTTYFKYRGLFDFYFGTRRSGPVIHRINNPALEARRYFNRPLLSSLYVRHVSVSVEHLSNGQDTDVSDGEDPDDFFGLRGAALAQRFFERNPNSAFFDTISREVDFVGLSGAFRLGPDAARYNPSTGQCRASSACVDLTLRWRPHYIHDDNPVVWGPSPWRTSEMADFDVVKIGVAKRWLFAHGGFGPQGLGIELEWTVGETFNDGDSLDVGVTLPFQFHRKLTLPVYVRWHRGPLNNLSNYSRPQNALGIGFQLN